MSLVEQLERWQASHCNVTLADVLALARAERAERERVIAVLREELETVREDIEAELPQLSTTALLGTSERVLQTLIDTAPAAVARAAVHVPPVPGPTGEVGRFKAAVREAWEQQGTGDQVIGTLSTWILAHASALELDELAAELLRTCPNVSGGGQG